MFFRIIGKYKISGSRLHVRSVNKRPFLFVDGALAQELSMKGDSPVSAEFKNPSDYRSTLVALKAAGVDKLLVLWDASHPRQKVKPSLCRGFTTILMGNYGASVIGIMDPGGCLVFQHRETIERVIYDRGSDKLVDRISHGH